MDKLIKNIQPSPCIRLCLLICTRSRWIRSEHICFFLCERMCKNMDHCSTNYDHSIHIHCMCLPCLHVPPATIKHHHPPTPQFLFCFPFFFLSTLLIHPFLPQLPRFLFLSLPSTAVNTITLQLSIVCKRYRQHKATSFCVAFLPPLTLVRCLMPFGFTLIAILSSSFSLPLSFVLPSSHSSPPPLSISLPLSLSLSLSCPG